MATVPLECSDQCQTNQFLHRKCRKNFLKYFCLVVLANYKIYAFPKSVEAVSPFKEKKNSVKIKKEEGKEGDSVSGVAVISGMLLYLHSFRYNKLLAVISQSLSDIVKALKGLVVMSSELELMANSLFNNAVPDMWKGKASETQPPRLTISACKQCHKRHHSVPPPCVLLLCFLKINPPGRHPQAYPSLKPLASWVSDLLQRINFMQGWISDGIPSVYWISGFFFPQAFLTGTLQNYARRSKNSIDTIGLDFKVSRRSPATATVMSL